MMKFLFGSLFMMLVSFKLNFWMIQMMMFMVFLMFIFNYLFNFLCGLSNLLGSDLISYILVLLSFWLGYLMMVLILIMFLFLTFDSLNLFLFYLSFEASLIPIWFIIVGWGYQPESIQAGVHMFFHTLSASLVFFVKLPMFLIHLWLPEAHVEAPIAGSMILAGVMLK